MEDSTDVYCRLNCSLLFIMFYSIFCLFHIKDVFALFGSSTQNVILSNLSPTLAYRGQKVRKQVADDKSKAKFEASIICLQASMCLYIFSSY